jgi:hypothetical protein
MIPPFRQLSRTVFSLEPAEPKSFGITRLRGIEVPLPILLGIVDRTGWSWITFQSGERSVQGHCKPFAFANVTAVLEYPNPDLILGYSGSSLSIERCFFLAGIYPQIQLSDANALPLGEIDPVVISEVLRNLGAIAAKGES